MRNVANCIICGHKHVTSEMTKVDNPKTHYSYVCGYCLTRMEDYSSNKANAIDKVKKVTPITTGIELECSGNQDLRRLKVLEHYGFVATRDSTVAVEYKSPVWNNLNGVAKLLYSALESRETGAGLPNRSCGTHVNVWCNNLNDRDFKRIRNYYCEIFEELYTQVKDDNFFDKRNFIKLWGRELNEWCSRFGKDVHKAFINVESSKLPHPRIEFRGCKYKNNKQFMNCLRMCNDIMKTIYVNFSCKYMTDKQGALIGLTPNEVTLKNTHKANITSKKILKVYKKYYTRALEK